MPDSLADLILSLVPEDGSSIGNKAMLALLQDRVPGISREAYEAARDELIAQGVLGRGRGQGGSIYRADVAELSLDTPEEAQAKSATGKPRKKGVRKKGEPPEVLSYRHTDKRVNNPEVGMVHATTDPDGPPRRWAYDPHLDPELNFDIGRAHIEKLIDDALASGDADTMRDALAELKRLQAPYLNWTGKAERTSFEIDTVSLHVHERIDPATILANAAKRLKGKDAATQWRQPDLFAAPFENLPLREALDFYKHEKGWSNRLITGDSLLVMNSLLTKESMAGKVQMIYIDPPYGIKYGSNFQPFVNKRDVKDRSDQDLTQEPEMIKAFRDTWELGIHSYLTYLRDRLLLARELLRETGAVFVQIGEKNVHIVRNLLDEVFGPENAISTICYKSAVGLGAQYVDNVVTYILFFAKDRKKLKFRNLYRPLILGEPGATRYLFVEDDVGKSRRMTTKERNNPSTIAAELRPYFKQGATSRSGGRTTQFPVPFMGKKYIPTTGGWRTGEMGMTRLDKSNRLAIEGNRITYKRFFPDFPATPFNNVWDDLSGGIKSRSDPKVFAVQTPTSVVERCLLMTTDPGDLVFDPTCGSGTTAFVAEKWGRRWITCDTSRVAITLAKQRLMTASFDYYALKYPHEGLKGGFDYQTVPHITLKSIANNPDIDTIYDEEHPKIEAALAELNATLKGAPARLKSPQGGRKGEWIDFSAPDEQTFTLPTGQKVPVNAMLEWEVPFDFPDDWPEAARAPFEAFHKARQRMQKRMDESIANHAEQETLYDKPRIDKSKLRITGPFSVEAVPAPVVRGLDDALPPTEADESIARMGETSRQAAWRDELLKTGIRAKGGAIIRIAELETVPGLKHIHASGSLADTGERIVVSFGPEYAALEQRQVEEAMNEAFTLLPRPKFLLFCAFTFDPEAAKDIDEAPDQGMTFLKVQMNTDLLTEDLKSKRASNESFWLMGQPDVELRRLEDGRWQVEVHGFDYFDPREGKVISGGKKQIAMWSLDTDYDQRSLMPHQVFFPMAGAKDGWNRLKKTVRAELDEDLLKAFHGTVSLPFEAGENRRIAVKIVDDRGIESLKIMELKE